MAPLFITFLLTLAMFLLVSLGAAAHAIWLRFRSTATPRRAEEQSPRQAKLADGLLLLGTALAWYSVAGCWVAQMTIYPIYTDMSAFGPEAFHGFSHGYLSRVAIGILPIAVMCLTWSLLLWFPCRNVPKRLVWIIIALCVAFIAITPISADAQDQMYLEGFSSDLYARLMWSNGVRTIFFIMIGLLSLVAVRRRWTFSEEPGA